MAETLGFTKYKNKHLQRHSGSSTGKCFAPAGKAEKEWQVFAALFCSAFCSDNVIVNFCNAFCSDNVNKWHLIIVKWRCEYPTFDRPIWYPMYVLTMHYYYCMCISCEHWCDWWFVHSCSTTLDLTFWFHLWPSLSMKLHCLLQKIFGFLRYLIYWLCGCHNTQFIHI